MGVGLFVSHLAPLVLPPRAVKDPDRMRGRDTQVDSHKPSLPVHRSPIPNTSLDRSSWPRRAANLTATVPRRQSPTTAPTYLHQTWCQESREVVVEAVLYGFGRCPFSGLPLMAAVVRVLAAGSRAARSVVASATP
jgi:hypothetical protein